MEPHMVTTYIPSGRCGRCQHEVRDTEVTSAAEGISRETYYACACTGAQVYYFSGPPGTPGRRLLAKDGNTRDLDALGEAMRLKKALGL